MKPLRLTDRMINFLMECHEREMLGHAPVGLQNMRGAKRLLESGYLECRYYRTKEGKPLIGFFITNMGKQMLDK